MKKIELPYPSYTGLLKYTGESIAPAWVDYDENTILIGGTRNATSSGTYTTTFTPKEGFCWVDNTVTPYSVTWTIYKDILTVPSQSGSLTYNDTIQKPTWKNYDSSKMTMGGTQSAKYAGTYEASFTPKSGYIWSDGTTETKKASWSIKKATAVVTVEPTSLTLSLSTDAAGKKITVTSTGSRPQLIGYGQITVLTCTSSYITDNTTEVLVKPVGIGTGFVRVGYNHLNSDYNQVQVDVEVTVTA